MLLALGGVVTAFLAASLLLAIVQAVTRAATLSAALAYVAGTFFYVFVPLLLFTAVTVVGWRLAFPPPFAPVPRARPVGPVPVPSEDAVRGLRMPVTACPDCGYLGLRMPQRGDGLWPGGGELGERRVCPRCGYQGIAVSFGTGEDYRAFVAGLA